MSALLEEEEGANGEDPERMITGSELVIAGDIPKKQETGDSLVSEMITSTSN